MTKGFIELYAGDAGELRQTCCFETGHFRKEIPQVGDIVVAPESMAGFFEPRDASVQKAYYVIDRYIVPDIKSDPAAVFVRVKLVVEPHTLTSLEASMWQPN